jgi:hypothetical protein
MDSLLKDILQAAQIGPPGEVIGCQIGKLALLATADQAGIGEFLDMVREGGSADRNLGFQHGTRHLPAAPGDSAKDIESSGVGERLGNLLQLGLGHQ